MTQLIKKYHLELSHQVVTSYQYCTIFNLLLVLYIYFIEILFSFLV